MRGNAARRFLEKRERDRETKRWLERNLVHQVCPQRFLGRDLAQDELEADTKNVNLGFSDES
jgi:hypothetical protein